MGTDELGRIAPSPQITLSRSAGGEWDATEAGCRRAEPACARASRSISARKPCLERAVRDGDATLRRLCVELVGKWRAPLCHRRRGGVPWTNNAAERAIGGSKIRRKTVGGYKSEAWMLNGFGLTRWACSGRDGLELSELVAALCRALRYGSRALRNLPQNDQPFLGRLRLAFGTGIAIRSRRLTVAPGRLPTSPSTPRRSAPSA